MPTLDLAGQALAYRDDGDGDRPPLLLLHANPGDSRDFDAVTPELARTFRVLRPDWPGYGASPAPAAGAGADHFLDVLARFIDALALPPVHLVGNSVGGNAAARYALRAPDRVASLLLVSPGGFTRHNPVTRTFCRLQGSPRVNALLARGFTRSYLRVRNEWTRAMIERADHEQSAPAARAVNASVWRSFLAPQHNLLESASAIRCPTLVMSGKHDPVIPAQKDGRFAAQAIPGARQVVFDCGHAPFAEVPQAFLAEARAFWSAHGAR